MKKFLIPFIIASVAGIIISSSFLGVFIWKTGSMENLQTDFQSLTTDFEDLLDDYSLLVGENEGLQEDYDYLISLYDNLQGSYLDLFALYNTLQAMYDTLEAELNAVIDMIKSLPMLDKMTFYYHWCRERYGFWISSLELGKRMILHGSWQYNGFTAVDDILDDYNFWDYGDSMADSWNAVTNCLGSWLQYWSGFYWEEDIFDWITNNLEYRPDSETTYNRVYWYDLYLSPLEMLKYRCGDCDDFAILGGAMFENNFYEVKYATIHDDTYYPGELHHAFLWVEVGEARIDSNKPFLNPNPKWSIGGGDYDWLIVDLTPDWQETIWKRPTWLKWYYDNGIPSSQWLVFENSINVNPP